MAEDSEIKAMSAMLMALEPLDNEGRGRVVDWVTRKLSIVGTKTIRDGGSKLNDKELSRAERDYTEFHELFDAAAPTTDVDKALVGGYWVQVCESSADFSGQVVNDLLKQLGHPVGNITRAFDGLQGHKPVLARQVQKTGKTKQGRKKYKLTREGEAHVQAMVRGEGAES